MSVREKKWVGLIHQFLRYQINLRGIFSVRDHPIPHVPNLNSLKNRFNPI